MDPILHSIAMKVLICLAGGSGEESRGCRVFLYTYTLSRVLTFFAAAVLKKKPLSCLHQQRRFTSWIWQFQKSLAEGSSRLMPKNKN